MKLKFFLSGLSKNKTLRKQEGEKEIQVVIITSFQQR